MRQKFLRSMLAAESRAYGFTIAFWGSGAVLINSFGAPGLLEALAYGLGAVTGFGILAVMTFGGATQEVEKDESEYLALATVHYLGSLAPIAFAGLLAQTGRPVASFFVGGLGVSLLYNLLSLLEEDI
ncbi:MAG: hypothetical protein SVQ76_02365, partial [Candidatus Nanohaloarchaea archaeon]|nr:hypothetical protein [Candidatus Nanohaloarchaea archaeon]